jgi:23S rRNA (adenine2030-N6)-methyltransferase
MLSYLHAYHAGGPADLHKHAGLSALLHLLTRKERPISYIESHAGRGVYDLSDPAALKTGESLRGIARLEPCDHPYWRAVETARRRHGPAAYPGSPAIARALLRPHDRINLVELHPAEHPALVAAMAGEGVSIHRRDGREAMRALTPPDPRRGLALIDPSYEVKSEYLETALTALELFGRWPEGVIVIWYPLLPDNRHEALLGPILAIRPRGLLRDEALFAEPPARGMFGSGLAIINAPFGADAALAEARAICAPVLASGEAAQVA